MRTRTFIGIPLIIFIIMLILGLLEPAHPAYGFTETFYVSATGNGLAPESANPDSAFDASDFNTLGNHAAIDANDGKIGPNDKVIILPSRGKIRAQLTIQQSGLSTKPITIAGTAGAIIAGLDTLNRANFDSSFATLGANVWAMATVAVDTTVSSMLYHTYNHVDSTTGFYCIRKKSNTTLTGDFWFIFSQDSVYVKMPTGVSPTTYLWEYDVRQYGIYASHKSYITIDSLNVKSFRKIDSGAGIYFYNNSGDFDNNVIISNCNISDVYYRSNPNYPSSTSWEYNYGYGINVINTNYTTINGNTISEAGNAGIMVQASGGNQIHNIHSHHNTISNSNIGVRYVIGTSTNNTKLSSSSIYNNTIYTFYPYYYCDAWHRDGIHSFARSDNATCTVDSLDIYNNYFYDDGTSGASSTAWIFLEYVITNSTIRHNILQKNPGGYAVWIKGFSTGNVGNNKIYNNTIYEDGVYYVNSTGNIQKNNIFYMTNPNVVDILSSAQTNFFSDYNLFMKSPDDSTSNVVKWGGTYYSLSEWQNTQSQDLNSIYGDPVLAGNPATTYINTVFKIASNSPAINAGDSLGLATDYFGTAIPDSGYADIGIHEYTVGGSKVTDYEASTATEAAIALAAMDDYDVLTLLADIDTSLTNTNKGQKIKGASPIIVSGKRTIIFTDSIASQESVEDSIQFLNDGGLWAIGNGNYPGTRDSTSAASSSNNSITVGANYVNPTYTVYRGFARAVIPNFTSIQSAKWYLNGNYNGSVTDTLIYIHSSTYNPTMTKTDYPLFDGRTIGGTHTGTILNDAWNTTSYSPDWNTITANASGLSYLTTAKGDTANFAFISAKDYNNIAPTGEERVFFETSSYATVALRPRLIINYTISSGPAQKFSSVLTGGTPRYIWRNGVSKTPEISFAALNDTTECWVSDNGDTLWVMETNALALASITWKAVNHAIGISDAGFDSCSVENLVFKHFNNAGVQYTGNYGTIYNTTIDSSKIGIRTIGTTGGAIVKNNAVLASCDSFAFNFNDLHTYNYNARGSLNHSNGDGANDLTAAITGVNADYTITSASNLKDAGTDVGWGNDIGADQYVKSILITAPNGGENWQVSSAQNITFTTDGVDSITIYYSNDGVAFTNLISISYDPSSGTYSWAIPNDQTSTASVKIADIFDSDYIDYSDAYFTISSMMSRFYLSKDGVITPLMKDRKVTPLKEP